LLLDVRMVKGAYGNDVALWCQHFLAIGVMIPAGVGVL
jgi:hypothetical protein